MRSSSSSSPAPPPRTTASTASADPIDRPQTVRPASLDSAAVNPYWLEEEAPPRRQVQHDGRVDVAIVGAGITGCSAALRLAEAGLRVRVHDQRGVAEGASGRNGGFALRGGATALRRRARDVRRRAGARALALDGAGARPHGGARRRRAAPARQLPPRRRRGGARADPWPSTRRCATTASTRSGSTTCPGTLAGRFDGGILHPGDGSLQPARFVRRLAARAAEAGAEIREHDRVDDVARARRRRTSSSRPTATATGSCPSSPTRSGRRADR